MVMVRMTRSRLPKSSRSDSRFSTQHRVWNAEANSSLGLPPLSAVGAATNHREVISPCLADAHTRDTAPVPQSLPFRRRLAASGPGSAPCGPRRPQEAASQEVPHGGNHQPVFLRAHDVLDGSDQVRQGEGGARWLPGPRLAPAYGYPCATCPYGR